jgi:hypothetical protein
MPSTRLHHRNGHDMATAAQLLRQAGINPVERFLASKAIRCGWPVSASRAPVDAAPAGKRVLVAGARPSGLSAACRLTRLQRQETVRCPRQVSSYRAVAYAPWCRWRYFSSTWIAIQSTKMMTGVIHNDGSDDPVAQRTSISAATAIASLKSVLRLTMTFSMGFMTDSSSAQ